METVYCQMAIQSLLTYLDQPDSPQSELDTALRHIAACSYCQRRVGYLARALNNPEQDTLTCGECEELLPEYYQAEIEGQASGARLRPVARHLATCPSCAAAYTTLLDLSALAFAEASGPPPDYPAFDLSFLREKKAQFQPALITRLDEWGRLIIQFSAEFFRAWQPPPFVAAGLKRSETSSKTLSQFSGQLRDDLEISVTVEQERKEPAYCTITMQVNIPSRGGWPNLAGLEVTLQRDQEIIATQVTDAHGEVVFEKIGVADLDQLVYEITLEERKT